MILIHLLSRRVEKGRSFYTIKKMQVCFRRDNVFFCTTSAEKEIDYAFGLLQHFLFIFLPSLF